MRVVQAPHMRLEVWAMMIKPVINAHSYIISILIKCDIAKTNVVVHVMLTTSLLSNFQKIYGELDIKETQQARILEAKA